MDKLTKQEIRMKLNLVVEKLLHLEEDKEKPEEGRETTGYFKRDFGIQEWDWPQGVGLYGITKMLKSVDDEERRQFLLHWYQLNINNGLPSKNINTTAPLLALVELNETWKNPEFEALTLNWARWLMESLPRTREGGFQHVTSANGDRQGVRLNDNQIWIDTIFMTVLFLNRMGLKYGRSDWVSESNYQMLIHIKYLCDKKSGLFYHGWNFNGSHNFGKVFWCRGNSWFTVGSLEYIEMFHGTMEDGIKRIITETYRRQVEALTALQSKSGLWNTVLDDPDSYEEVSGSAAIAAGIIKGIRMGILDSKYLECAWSAVAGILQNIGEDGTVFSVSGGTGMGEDREHYKNILISPMAYGQALVILALCEALDMI
nr:glycoside hydrolase family 88 protein [uncultured Clostridium sp.]